MLAQQQASIFSMESFDVNKQLLRTRASRAQNSEKSSSRQQCVGCKQGGQLGCRSQCQTQGAGQCFSRRCGRAFHAQATIAAPFLSKRSYYTRTITPQSQGQVPGCSVHARHRDRSRGPGVTNPARSITSPHSAQKSKATAAARDIYRQTT